MRDEAGLRWLLPRLRAWRPANVTITVMLDGHPDPGEAHRRRVATGVEFRHSGDYDGDSAIVATLRARPYAERSRTIVVTDDRQLGDRVRHTGGMVRRLDWLVNGLAASVGEPAPAAGPIRGNATTDTAGSGPRRSRRRIGAGRRPSAPRDQPTPDASEEREPWRPGRGATAKRGNPRKSPKHGPPKGWHLEGLRPRAEAEACRDRGIHGTDEPTAWRRGHADSIRPAHQFGTAMRVALIRNGTASAAGPGGYAAVRSFSGRIAGSNSKDRAKQLAAARTHRAPNASSRLPHPGRQKKAGAWARSARCVRAACPQSALGVGKIGPSR